MHRLDIIKCTFLGSEMFCLFFLNEQGKEYICFEKIVTTADLISLFFLFLGGYWARVLARI